MSHLIHRTWEGYYRGSLYSRTWPWPWKRGWRSWDGSPRLWVIWDSMNIHVQIDTTGHRIGCVKWISVWDMQVLSFPTWYVNMYLTSLWGAQHVLSHHQDALGSLREDRGQTPNFETQRRCLALRMAGRQRERGGHKWGLLRDHQKLMIQVT